MRKIMSLCAALGLGACAVGGGHAPTPTTRLEGAQEVVGEACAVLAGCDQAVEPRCEARLLEGSCGEPRSSDGDDDNPCAGVMTARELAERDACLAALAGLDCAGTWPPVDCREILGYP